MANAAAKLFVSYLETKEINARFLDEEEKVVRVGWKLNNTSLGIIFFFSDDCSDVSLRGSEFINVPKDKADKVYKIINDCNNKYRWIKFVYNEGENEVRAEVDAVIQLDSCAEECFELMIRMSNIVDDAYPEFMKAMWA